ncbi:hydrogen peroxide-inducible genes activator [Palleronia caenipelagi]|uniref:LysR family transcriptional regulator n=1 Tax=Palleronia caenipelagi TaxID=2489174 RepID=A0A547QA13_9RHOB|nr:hydrogen peroxide-inducible genes activator [Palleronia caenipelagi]TRD23186.1 LysR family transcriptional regulator [Palleronia caenipelagi]
MKRLTLRHLRYFEALARHEHFGRTAEILSISQPALSVQIRELQEILGTDLLEKGSRRVVLTHTGRDFAVRAREILKDVDSLSEIGAGRAGELGGQLRLGVIPTIAPYLLPGIIARLQAEMPQIQLRPREAITERLIRDLRDGELDLALLALPISEPGLHEEPLFDEEFVFVRPAAEADRPMPPVEALREMRLLLLEEGHCFRDQALEVCALSPGVARDMMEGSSLTTLVQMVGAGIGVTLIPEMAVPLETRLADVAVARFATPRPTRSIGLVWRETSPFATEFRALASRMLPG